MTGRQPHDLVFGPYELLVEVAPLGIANAVTRENASIVPLMRQPMGR